jgi:hypothetical protein
VPIMQRTAGCLQACHVEVLIIGRFAIGQCRDLHATVFQI